VLRRSAGEWSLNASVTRAEARGEPGGGETEGRAIVEL
jgi:hypothetical protein